MTANRLRNRGGNSMYEPSAILDRQSIERPKAPRKEGVLLRVTGTMPPRGSRCE